MSDWYETVVATAPLSQGDILNRCPVFFPDDQVDYNNLPDPAEVQFTIDERDVIVMSQSCDLDKCPPDRNVILCPLADLTQVPKQGHLGNLRDNRIVNIHLLNKSQQYSLDYQIIDFAQLYTLPFGVLNNWKNSQGDRIRLKSPYMEQMSQRFGNYFMRIGLENGSMVSQSELLSRWTQLNPGKK